MKRTPFTKQGHLKLLKEKEDLEKQRIDAVVNLKNAREMGDLSENAAYKVARMKLSSVDRRLRILNRVLEGAYIIEAKSTDVVEVGSVVTLQGKKGETKFTIVSSHESDVSVGKISYYSPIGTALMGKRLNSTVIVKTPSGDITYTITKISA
jgi:transcription elongation factor GreA